MSADLVQLQNEGLLALDFYSLNFTSPIKPFIRTDKIPNCSPCFYSLVAFEEQKRVRKQRKVKRIAQAKIFEYMCMSYIFNKFVNNQGFKADIPPWLKAEYTESPSVQPYFSVKYQTTKFIKDNTALYDIDFSSFCDTTADYLTLLEGVTRKSPFEKIKGVDIKVTSGDTIYYSDSIRAIDKFIKLAGNESISYGQIIGKKGNPASSGGGEVENGQDFVSKIYMFDVNESFIRKILSPDILNPSKHDILFERLFNLNLSRKIYEKIWKNKQFLWDKDADKIVKQAKIIEHMASSDSMDILVKYYFPGDDSQTFKNRADTILTSQGNEKFKTALNLVITTVDNGRAECTEAFEIEGADAESKTLKDKIREIYTKNINPSRAEVNNYLKGETHARNGKPWQNFKLKPCGLDRTDQLCFGSIDTLMEDLPSICNGKIFNHYIDKDEPDYPTLLFGQVSFNSKKSSKSKVGKTINSLETALDRMMVTGWSQQEQGQQSRYRRGKNAFKKFLKQTDTKTVNDFVDNFQQKRGILEKQLTRQLRDGEIQNIDENDVDKILQGAYDYYYDQQQQKQQRSASRGGGGAFSSCMGSSCLGADDDDDDDDDNDNMVLYIQCLLFRLYYITNLDEISWKNIDENSQIWNIISRVGDALANILKNEKLTFSVFKQAGFPEVQSAPDEVNETFPKEEFESVTKIIGYISDLTAVDSPEFFVTEEEEEEGKKVAVPSTPVSSGQKTSAYVTPSTEAQQAKVLIDNVTGSPKETRKEAYTKAWDYLVENKATLGDDVATNLLIELKKANEVQGGGRRKKRTKRKKRKKKKKKSRRKKRK